MRFYVSLCLLIGLASTARADFSYEQVTRITGGSVASLMKMAGPFTKNANEPQVSSVVVKGAKMANIDKNQMTIVDADARTITMVNLDKKTYSVLTFEQMKQVYEEMQKRLQGPETATQGNEVKVDVKETGERKSIGGLETRQVITTVTMSVNDPRAGEMVSTVVTDAWMTAEVPGYDEVRALHRKMAEAAGWTPAAPMGQSPMVAQGMVRMTGELSKVEGVPVLQIVKVSGGSAMQLPPGAEPPRAPTGNEAAQGAADAAQRSAEQEAIWQAQRAGGAAGRIGGAALGGLMGGMRRGKQKNAEAAPAPAPPAAPAPAETPAPGSGGGSNLLEMTTEISKHSNAPVDASRLAVPAGFQKVENEMLKTLQRP